MLYLCKKKSMIIEITKKTTKEQIAKFLNKLKIGKSLDAKMYCGALKLDLDGLEYQKQMRNECD